MRRVNPAFVPLNHRVEQALDAAIEHGDFSPFAELLTVLSHPYDDQPLFADYANPPKQTSASSGHSAGLEIFEQPLTVIALIHPAPKPTCDAK